jgi:DNA-directed RNA polymerase specialized sigma24 family protein
VPQRRPRPGPAAGDEWDEWDRRLATLSAPVRSAVVLRHVVGLPYAEVAVALGRPVGTVKADVHRGLQRLRLLIESEVQDER